MLFGLKHSFRPRRYLYNLLIDIAMKRLFLRLSLCMAAVSMLAVAGCKSGENKPASSDTSGSVTDFPIAIDIKSASADFKVSDSTLGYDCFLTLDCRIQWPQSIGSYDLSTLQDSIISMAFGAGTPTAINDAITAFVNDYKRYGLGTSAVKVDSVPEESPYNNMYYSNISVSLAEVSEQIVTFNVTSEQYMGGAHPIQQSYPFSYDLESGVVIDCRWLFKDGYNERLVAAITDVIATQLNMPESDLNQAMLVDTLPISTKVYIEDGQIVFHYNPYDILPYSYGSIDAAIPPYLVSDILTPQAASLLNYQ